MIEQKIITRKTYLSY